MKIDHILDYRLLRFAIVGSVSNGILFMAYLVLTQLGLNSKIAVATTYITSILLSFLFNKKWTFSHNGQARKTFSLYVFLYGIGYLINLLILFILVDKLGIQHQWVQGGATLFLAGFFFLAQKFFVFKTNGLQRRIS